VGGEGGKGKERYTKKQKKEANKARRKQIKREYKAHERLAKEKGSDTSEVKDSSNAIAEIKSQVITAIAALKGPRVCVVGGRTGVGKTRVLHALRDVFGQKVIDLEGLADHRGSSFGWCAQVEQPSSEHYANLVAGEWFRLSALTSKPKCSDWVFIEDEDDHIGSCVVPEGIYAMLRYAPLVVSLKVPEQARINLLKEDYAGEAARSDGDWLAKMEASILRLKKRLGGVVTKKLVDSLKANDVGAVAKGLLSYYDTLYDKHLVNSSGTGSGEGSRAGVVLQVEQPPNQKEVDAELLALGVLQKVAEFEAHEHNKGKLSSP